MTKIYKSRIGIELILILGSTFGSIAVVMAVSGDYSAILINVFVAAVIGYVLWKTEYVISNTNLNVKCSFFVNEDIDIMTIRKIKETYNPISAPAASIDRLEVFYNKWDSVLISPKQKSAFIDHLLQINRSIEIIKRK